MPIKKRERDENVAAGGHAYSCPLSDSDGI
jgi:hypothetical protein